MTPEEERRLALLAAILHVGGHGRKAEVLDTLAELDIVLFASRDFEMRPSRPELVWRNEFAYIRQHLVGKYVSNQHDDWAITEAGRVYARELADRAVGLAEGQYVRLSRAAAIVHASLEHRGAAGSPVFESRLVGNEARLSAEEADQPEPILEEIPRPSGIDQRALVQRQIRARRGQTRFRNALRSRYGDRCLVTGCEVLAVLEAAHISTCPGQDDNRPENGLLLRSDIHTLFDLDLLGIEPEHLRVELHPAVAAEYGHVRGITLRCGGPRPSREELAERYERFRQRLLQPA